MQKIKNKIMWLPLLLNYFIWGVFLYYMIFLWKSYPFSIGGTLIFISVIGIMNYFSIIYKDYVMEFSLFSFVLFLLMALNFFAFFEYQHGYSWRIEAIMCALIVTVTILARRLTINPIRLKENSNLSVERRELQERISYIVSHSFMITGFYAVVTATVFSAIRGGRLIGKECTLYFSNLSFMWLGVGLIFVLLLMRRWSYLDEYISSLVVKRSQINMIWMRKWFGPLIICIFLLGLGVEIQRGFWLLWFFSWLVFVLIVVMIWKVWRFVFEQEPLHIDDSIEIERVRKFPSRTEPMYAFKFVLVNTILGALYCFILIFIEMKYCK
jgi:hypothetical protein